MRPLLAAIARHDRELERQMRRAMSSVVLNIPEGAPPTAQPSVVRR